MKDIFFSLACDPLNSRSLTKNCLLILLETPKRLFNTDKACLIRNINPIEIFEAQILPKML